MLHKFEMSPKELEAAKEFERKHLKCRGSMEVTFTITGIGLGVRVRCSRCQKEKNVTDYDAW